MITRNCLICGREINTCPSWNTQYCSKECYAKSMMKRHSVICKNCGKEFVVPNSSTQQCCSKECANAYRKKLNAVRRETDKKYSICPVCGATFELKDYRQTFCSRACGYAGKVKYRPNYDEADRQRLSEKLKKQWEDPNFRQLVVNRMKTNNPMYIPGVAEKASQTGIKNGSYHNNFKYGNGKISEYEKRVYTKLEPLGFIYNYAIPTGQIRLQFPEKHYPNNYKPDFVNLEEKLCLEVDGYGHSSAKEIALDHKKEECLILLGFTVIRFTHLQIDNGEFDAWLNSYQKDI